MTKRKKQTSRYVVEINDWGCGTLIKDTITGKEIDAPKEETVNLCLAEMNRLAAELKRLKKTDPESITDVDIKADPAFAIGCFRFHRENEQAKIKRLTKAGDAMAKVLGKIRSYDGNQGRWVAPCEPELLEDWLAAKKAD